MAQIKTKFIQDSAVTTDKLNNGAVTDAKVSSGIDAAKIGNGDVSNAELSHLNGVTSGVQTQLDAKIPSSEKGANSGVATLDAGGKIPSSQLPAIAITEVFAVADITARDALTIGSGTGEVQEGDVVRVTDASADPSITSGAASYIYDGSAYVLLKAGDEVLSVNGQTGVISLDTDDISEGSNLYYTEARVSANADVAANTAARHDAVTLAAGATSQALSLSGQELTSNAATGSTAGHMSAADKSKLDGIESGATADQTGAEIKAAYEAEADTNAFTDAEKSKLSGIESGATADQTGAEIKAAYEAEANTNAFTDAEQTKLAGIEANAKDDQNASEVPYTNTTSGLTATDVQAAIDEVEGRVDSLEGATAPASASEAITLLAGDITAESVSLSNSPRNGSIVLSVDGVVQTPGVDYSVSGSSLRFGDAADAGLTSSDLDPTSGAAALIAGDILVVKYEY